MTSHLLKLPHPLDFLFLLEDHQQLLFLLVRLLRWLHHLHMLPHLLLLNLNLLLLLLPSLSVLHLHHQNVKDVAPLEMVLTLIQRPELQKQS